MKETFEKEIAILESALLALISHSLTYLNYIVPGMLKPIGGGEYPEIFKTAKKIA